MNNNKYLNDLLPLSIGKPIDQLSSVLAEIRKFPIIHYVFFHQYRAASKGGNDKVKELDWSGFPINMAITWYYVCLHLEKKYFKICFQKSTTGKHQIKPDYVQKSKDGKLKIDTGGFIAYKVQKDGKIQKDMISPLESLDVEPSYFIVLKRVPRRERLNRYNELFYQFLYAVPPAIGYDMFEFDTSQQNPNIVNTNFISTTIGDKDDDTMMDDFISQNQTSAAQPKQWRQIDKSYTRILPNDFSRDEYESKHAITRTLDGRLCKRIHVGLPNGCMKSDLVHILDVSDTDLSELVVYRYHAQNKDSSLPPVKPIDLIRLADWQLTQQYK